MTQQTLTNKDEAPHSAVALHDPLTCTYCGGVLDNEQAADPYRDEDGDIMCDECYSDHYEYLCPLCENLQAIEGNQEHIIVTTALAEDQRMQSGLYRITARPWFSSNYFSMTIHQNAVTREADLPGTATDMVFGDYVCETCAGSLTGTSRAGSCEAEPLEASTDEPAIG